MKRTTKKSNSFSVQGSPYLRVIDNVMGRCVMSGLTRKWLRDIYSVYQQKQPEERTHLESQEVLINTDNGLVSI